MQRFEFLSRLSNLSWHLAVLWHTLTTLLKRKIQQYTACIQIYCYKYERMKPGERRLLASCFPLRCHMHMLQLSSLNLSKEDNMDKNLCWVPLALLRVPCLDFLPYSMSKVVKFNIPRGGGPASACFSPTKHDLVRVTPTCLPSQCFEGGSHGLMGVVWHTGPTPLIYPYWNLQALLRK